MYTINILRYMVFIILSSSEQTRLAQDWLLEHGRHVHNNGIPPRDLQTIGGMKRALVMNALNLLPFLLIVLVRNAPPVKGLAIRFL